MSNESSELAAADLVADAYRSPPHPHRYRPNAARFWTAFGLVLAGHAVSLIGMAFILTDIRIAYIVIAAGIVINYTGIVFVDKRIWGMRSAQARIFQYISFVIFGALMLYLPKSRTVVNKWDFAALVSVLMLPFMFNVWQQLTRAIRNSIVEDTSYDDIELVNADSDYPAKSRDDDIDRSNVG
jgi:hypothetical protein